MYPTLYNSSLTGFVGIRHQIEQNMEIKVLNCDHFYLDSSNLNIISHFEHPAAINQNSIQGDTSGCDKPPVDFKTKVPLWCQREVWLNLMCHPVHKNFLNIYLNISEVLAVHERTWGGAWTPGSPGRVRSWWWRWWKTWGPSWCWRRRGTRPSSGPGRLWCPASQSESEPDLHAVFFIRHTVKFLISLSHIHTDRLTDTRKYQKSQTFDIVP